MLVLTRRVGEAIILGDHVSIRILQVNGKHITLGIDAPKKLTVHREEIYEKIRLEKILKLNMAENS